MDFVIYVTKYPSIFHESPRITRFSIKTIWPGYTATGDQTSEPALSRPMPSRKTPAITDEARDFSRNDGTPAGR